MVSNAPFAPDEICRTYSSIEEWESVAMEIFEFQYKNNEIYSKYCDSIGVKSPKNIYQIPFLPISFFKSHRVSSKPTEEIIFTSSGTTGSNSSRHYVYDRTYYQKSFLETFKNFYRDPTEWCILALLPSYLEREGSSLIMMAEELINKSQHSSSGFFLSDYEKLNSIIEKNLSNSQKTMLIGVSFALLDFAEKYSLQKNTLLTVMETGGMKGKRKEMIREELHQILKVPFGVEKIHSEYGMTELLSQAYSIGNGVFKTPPWMKVLIREQDDPFSYCNEGKSGGINVIDFANIYSCSFISTQDLGKINKDGFEVLGRFDSSEARGCNLMVL